MADRFFQRTKRRKPKWEMMKIPSFFPLVVASSHAKLSENSPREERVHKDLIIG